MWRRTQEDGKDCDAGAGEGAPPSSRAQLAAGNDKHFTIVMGDWNIKYDKFRGTVLTAADYVQAQDLGSTSVCALRTNQRDMAAVFHENPHWVVKRDDAIPDDTYTALNAIIGVDHEVLLFMLVLSLSRFRR